MRFAVPKALACLAVLALLTPAKPALADGIVNGDFSAGLSGWQVGAPPPIGGLPYATVSISDGSATVSDDQFLQSAQKVVSVDANGIATIGQTSDFNVNEIDLYQVFTIPTGAQSLQFTLNNLTLDTSGDLPPPGFGVSLLDPTDSSALVSTTSGISTDSYYTQDLTTDTASYTGDVTLSTDPISNLTTISESLSGLTGSQVEILFKVIDGGDFSANVSISDVKLVSNNQGGSPAVPEPGTFGMLLTGMTGLVWMKRRRLRFP